jgi:predicted nucleic acid-binding protein
MTVVSNSSPIIALARVSKLQLLSQLFGTVFIPDGVYKELTQEGKAGAEEVERGLIFKKENIKNQGELLRLAPIVGRTDAEVIILAKEKEADVALIDDRKLLKQAELQNIPAITITDILLEAKKKGLITSAKEVMDEMAIQGIGISEEDYEDTLRQAGEI